jgi:4-aminobutyrate aminotransferase/(S)-3-amino-2-methylpropionate transaminase
MNIATHNAKRLLALRDQHVPRGIITAHPVVAARGEGAQLWDVDGKRFLDFVGGIGVLNTGHCHPRLVEAVRRQVGEISHASFQVAAYEPYLEVVARLNHLIGGEEHFKNSAQPH